MKVQEFLNEQGVAFETFQHPATFTAQRMADTIDVPGDMVVKTVVLNVDGDSVLAVLQATHAIDMERVRAALGAQSVKLATENELSKLFSDCELGAIPPFGSRYGMKTLVDQALTRDEEIYFEGNDHTQTFHTSYRDYETIERPQVASFSYHI